MKIKIFKKNILIGILLTVHCVWAGIPDWAKNHQHKNYPRSHYFIGVGVAGDKTQSIERARADVAKQLRVKIESELETIETEWQQDDKHELSSMVKSQTKSLVSETISGIEIAKVKKSKGQYYTLAALNKQKYLAGLEVEMDAILNKTQKLVQNARQFLQQGKVFPAIQNYINAQNIIPEFYVKSSLYSTLSGEKHPRRDQLSAQGILSEMRGILSHIELNIVSGNQQQAYTGQYLSDPVVVRVTYQTDSQEIGIDNFPLLAKYNNGEIITQNTTHSDGRLSVKVRAVPTEQGGDRGQVVFSTNLYKLPENMRSFFEQSQVSVAYQVKVADLSFAVRVDDRSGSRFPEIEEKFKTYVTENGYKIDDQAAYVIEGHLAITNDKTIDSPLGKQYYIESMASLNLIDRENGRTLSTIKAQGKGLAMGSYQDAVAKAYQNLSLSKKDFASFLLQATKE